MNKDLLKEILAIPTRTGEEQAVIHFLERHAEEFGYDHHTDKMGNVYMAKGKLKPGQERWPLVCAHTDSVHSRRAVQIIEGDGMLWAVDAATGEKCGCGGDDKSGIFICLELLQQRECLKAAFFVSEETGCHGSRGSEAEFFKDVAYCMEFDSPQGDIISFSCDGVQLFEEDGEFASVVVPVLEAHKVDKWQHHPYTDVAPLKRRFDFSCINLPAGYYYMHSSREYVELKDVENAITFGGKLIDALGFKHYAFKSLECSRGGTKRRVTGLILD